MPAPTMPTGAFSSTTFNALAAYVDDILGVGVTSVSNVDTVSRTTTSGVFTTTLTPANICGVAFRAPTSGKVLILWVSELTNTGANFTLVSPEIREGVTVGSGTIVLAASTDRTIRNDSTTNHRYGASYLHSGLTPGADYNVALNHQVAAGTGAFVRREVQVIPMIF
jgi:hypothetical protein